MMVKEEGPIRNRSWVQLRNGHLWPTSYIYINQAIGKSYSASDGRIEACGQI